MNYDLIGDIHGHSAPLVELLEKLDYRVANGVFRHPTRQVIFLGDFIDRGPKQREVIEIVRPMIDDGAALPHHKSGPVQKTALQGVAVRRRFA